MPMVTVSISPMQVASIRAAIDSGKYASSSEVVRDALRMWDAARKGSHGYQARPLTSRLAPGENREGTPVVDMLAEHEAEKRARN